MTDQHNTRQPLFFLQSANHLLALKSWLENMKYTSYRDGLEDKNGQPMIGLKNGKERAGIIVAATEELADEAFNLVTLNLKRA